VELLDFERTPVPSRDAIPRAARRPAGRNGLLETCTNERRMMTVDGNEAAASVAHRVSCHR